MNPYEAVEIPRGFRAAGATAGIKPSGRPDIALVMADQSVPACAVFTRNACAAAPVIRGRRILEKRRLRGVAVNSGNANAATGERGLRDAERMAELTAAFLSEPGGTCDPEQILVCSTGVIGVPLPMEIVSSGLRTACAALSDQAAAWHQASLGIMTTDTRPKMASRTVRATGEGGETSCRILGMCKGAGMIHPDMATMLAFVFTDARIEPDALHEIFREAAANSFNAISIDGDTSTNDTAAILASGATDFVVDRADSAAGRAFRQALRDLMLHLAKSILLDQEGGIQTLCRIEVIGARDALAARRLAESVATSSLFKSALHGADPNWGRVVAGLGNAGVELRLEDIDIDLGPFALLRAGTPVEFSEKEASRYLKSPETHFRISVGAGPGAFSYYTGDLSEEYVTFNSDYTT